jgi:hypothetical protein
MRRTDRELQETDCLERLVEELEHPNKFRRAGARAALGWLSRIVDLRVKAEREPRVAAAPASLEQAICTLEQALFDRALDRSGDGPAEPN